MVDQSENRIENSQTSVWMADSLKKLDPLNESMLWLILSPGNDKNLIARCLFSSGTCGELSTKLVLLLVLGNFLQFQNLKYWPNWLSEVQNNGNRPCCSWYWTCRDICFEPAASKSFWCPSIQLQAIFTGLYQSQQYYWLTLYSINKETLSSVLKEDIPRSLLIGLMSIYKGIKVFFSGVIK